MTINEEQLVTKEYLDAKLDAKFGELRAEIYRLHADTLGMFAGLYAGVILSYFIK